MQNYIILAHWRVWICWTQHYGLFRYCAIDGGHLLHTTKWDFKKAKSSVFRCLRHLKNSLMLLKNKFVESKFKVRHRHRCLDVDLLIPRTAIDKHCWVIVSQDIGIPVLLIEKAIFVSSSNLQRQHVNISAHISL